MSREKIARFRARIKDPDLLKTVKNAIEYRQRKKMAVEETYAFLLKTYGEKAGISDSDLSDLGVSELPLQPDSGRKDGGLNSAYREAECEAGGLNPNAQVGKPPQSDELKAEISALPSPSDKLNSVLIAESIPPDGLNSADKLSCSQMGDLNSAPEIWHPRLKIPTEAEVAAEISRMQGLEVSRLHLLAEGVVIEMPQIKPRPQADAEPKKETSKRILVRPKKSKATERSPAVLPSRPPTTRALFCAVALLTLVGFTAYYLISATQLLYGTLASVILVAIPMGVVFFIDVVGLRYGALAVFLLADLWSLKALQEREIAEVHSTALIANPEYQRLKVDHANLMIERKGISADTHPTIRRRVARDMAKVSERMAVIESTSKPESATVAETTRTEVTLAIRALFLLALTLFAHPLVRYAKAIDFDMFMRKLFGRE
jgi:hypothetical protein